MKSIQQKGFTIVELLLTMGIFAILTSLATINLVSAQHTASIDTTTTTLVADLKQQQTKAMTGDTEGRSAPSPYGVHFDTTKYVLFHGTYNAADTSNFTINLEGSLRFTTTGDILFSQVSGERTGLNPIVLQDSMTTRHKSITTNTYGVITTVN